MTILTAAARTDLGEPVRDTGYSVRLSPPRDGFPDEPGLTVIYGPDRVGRVFLTNDEDRIELARLILETCEQGNPALAVYNAAKQLAGCIDQFASAVKAINAGGARGLEVV